MAQKGNPQQPCPPAAVHPPQQAGYPPQQAGYPPQQAGYPPQQVGYPSQTGYPPNQPGYPAQQPGYIPQQPGYPAQQPGYPAQQPGYPAQSGYPPQPGYPPQQPAYPPQQPGYPAQQLGYPPQQPGYAPQQAGYPAQHVYQTQAGHPQQHQGHPPQPASHAGAVAHGMANLSISAPSQASPYTPTLLPANPFDANADAQALKNAMKGRGCDKKVITSILTRRSWMQRQQIAEAYKRIHGKDLTKELRNELRGKLEDVVIALMTPMNLYLAQQVYLALHKYEDDVDRADLVEILCTANNNTLQQINMAYGQLYKRFLEKDLSSRLSGDLRKLMIAMCRGARDENYIADVSRAQADAQALFKAGALRLGTDESTFNHILTQRSFVQLQLILQEYQKLTGRNLIKDIGKEFSGSAKDGLLAIIHTSLNREKFFAERLKKTMAGVGTRDSDLIRILVTRCEVDLGNIKKEYLSLYGKTLANDITKDTSGDYRLFLLGLLGD